MRSERWEATVGLDGHTRDVPRMRSIESPFVTWSPECVGKVLWPLHSLWLQRIGYVREDRGYGKRGCTWKTPRKKDRST
jgi:hypothetical protein